MGEEAPKAGELGDGCRGSEKWENSQKGGSSSVEEGAWCWEGVVVREWRIREGPRPGKEVGAQRGLGKGAQGPLWSSIHPLKFSIPLPRCLPSLNTAAPKGLSKGLS